MLKTLKTYFSFLLGWKRAFFVFLLVSVCAGALTNLSPYIYKLMVEAIPRKDPKILLRIIVLFVGIKLAGHYLSVLSNYAGDRAAIPAANHIREKIFTHVQKLDFAFHANKKTGSLISAFKRGDTAFWGLFLNTRHILEVIIGFLVGLFFFSRLSLRLLLVMSAVFALNFFAGYLLIKKNIRKREELNKKEDRVTGVIADNFLNYETVKYFAGEQKERKRLHQNLEHLMKKAWAYANSFRLMDFVIGSVSVSGMFLILFMGFNRFKRGGMTGGDLVMVASFTTTFYYQSFRLLYQARKIAKSFEDLKRYFSLLDKKPTIKDPKKPVAIKNPKGKIVFNRVTFDYPRGKEEAVLGLDLEIAPGETVAFVGRSGAGKTTLVKLLFRLYNLREGRILIDGVDIKDMKKKDLRKIVGIVPQEPILFNQSIGFNIGFAKKEATQKEITKVVKMANLEEFVKSLPRGLDTKVGERGIKLSGGQKQRLAIARMLLENPKIIVFDEATSQLDSESEALIQQALWRIAEGRTVLIIAHRFSTLRNADRIVVLENGRLKEKGNHTELIKKGGLYKHLWDLQAQDNTFTDIELS